MACLGDAVRLTALVSTELNLRKQMVVSPLSCTKGEPRAALLQLFEAADRVLV